MKRGSIVASIMLCLSCTCSSVCAYDEHSVIKNLVIAAEKKRLDGQSIPSNPQLIRLYRDYVFCLEKAADYFEISTDDRLVTGWAKRMLKDYAGHSDETSLDKKRKAGLNIVRSAEATRRALVAVAGEDLIGGIDQNLPRVIQRPWAQVESQKALIGDFDTQLPRTKEEGRERNTSPRPSPQ